MNGLKRLEYRGYDSAGVGLVVSDGQSTKLRVVKKMVRGTRWRPGRTGCTGSSDCERGVWLHPATA